MELLKLSNYQIRYTIATILCSLRTNTLFHQSSLIQTLILVQSSVFIHRLRVMLRYMHSYLTLLMTKYTATDSNNLKCHALLAALYLPLESTSHSVLLLTHFFHHGNLHSSQCQIFRFCIIISRT